MEPAPLAQVPPPQLSMPTLSPLRTHQSTGRGIQQCVPAKACRHPWQPAERPGSRRCRAVDCAARLPPIPGCTVGGWRSEARRELGMGVAPWQASWKVDGVPQGARRCGARRGYQAPWANVGSALQAPPPPRQWMGCHRPQADVERSVDTRRLGQTAQHRRNHHLPASQSHFASRPPRPAP